MDELTPEQEQAVAATVGAIQRIAMAVVELPQEQRERHYALVRRNFEAAITHFGMEGAMAHAWLNSTMIGFSRWSPKLKLAVALRAGTLRSLESGIQNVRNRARNRSPRRETSTPSSRVF